MNDAKRKPVLIRTSRTGKLSVETTDGEYSGSDWQAALDRVLLYLRTLGIHPVASLDLAQQAISRAEARVGGGKNRHPVAEAMRQARFLVRNRLARRGLRNLLSPAPVFTAGQTPLALSPGALAMPSLNRKPMVPGDFERSPWSFLQTLFSGPRSPSSSRE